MEPTEAVRREMEPTEAMQLQDSRMDIIGGEVSKPGDGDLLASVTVRGDAVVGSRMFGPWAPYVWVMD
ncbi:hypothetical protein E2P81_ATG12036 [Venturia nashicola]|uniref:Uncharacterized protein n=1 Tax=Venturia nashicola TaxID=86259 RepID=A0A4Z1NPV9_9PEZI|nr:hypothetical protein E6O75_ATG11736 [Venturia nashicola]TLD24700.1 hypothetical protein E2P81_ATG12036 [Venturia nashicola]